MRRILGTYVVRLALLLAVAGPLLAPVNAHANAAPAKMPPDSGGLIVPATTPDIRIDREKLSFDLTSSPDSAQVSASYELTNISSKDVSLDAIFLAAQGRDMSLSLNGKPLETREATNADLPPEWLASSHGLDPLTGQDYVVDEYLPSRIATRAWAFRLQVPAGGRATLAAAYRAELGYDRARYKYVVRHLAYVLGPARNWAGFGALEVVAAVPSRYLLASSPGLTKDREENGVTYYAGTFDSIPAELLRLSTVAALAAAPPNDSTLQTAVTMFVPQLLVAALTVVAMLVLFSKMRPRRLLPLIAGFISAAMVLVIGMLVSMALAPGASNEDLSGSGGYGELGVIFIWVAWTFIFLPVVTGISTGVTISVRARGR